jgi:hypothetical protein
MAGQATLHLAQSHQTFCSDWEVTASGFSLPFLVGCHSLASLGNNFASELVSQTF